MADSTAVMVPSVRFAAEAPKPDEHYGQEPKRSESDIVVVKQESLAMSSITLNSVPYLAHFRDRPM